MAALRCSLCGISYPVLPQFTVCPIHDEETAAVKNIDPDPDWMAQFERLQRQVEKSNELTRVIPLIRGVEPHEEAGLLWVTSDSLYRSGAKFNSAFGGFYLFELEDGWVYETQGWDEPRRRWWIERVTRSAEGEASQPTTSVAAHSSTESATS